MAAIELSDLVPNLVAQVSPPGRPLYTGVAEADWIPYLLNGFYQAKLEGVLGEWQADEDGAVTAKSGDRTMPRELQHIVVIYAGIDIVRNELRQLKSVFKAKAGPVQYETQQHATVLRAILDSLLDQKQLVLERLVDQGIGGMAFVIDSVIARDRSINRGLTAWVGY